MNRIIKFRVWAEDAKYMSNPFDLYDIQEKRVEFAKSGFVLMQFTGLKDKHGKEIYEGDIIENNDIKWVVDWYEGGVYMKQIGKEHNTWWIGGEHQYCEVIGNLYENPELLDNNK